MRLVAPIVFVGRTALSVDINTKVFTPDLIAASAQLSVPNTLLCTPSVSLNSTIGTLLNVLLKKAEAQVKQETNVTVDKSIQAAS